MPNFQTYVLKPLTYPCQHNDTCFECEAISARNNKLVVATTKGETYLVRVSQKDEKRLLIKGDKVTRPSQASILQKVLMDFRDVSEATEICSNIEPKRALHVKRSPFLKSIDFFASRFEVTQEIWIEVGFGSGRHLLHQAKKHPQIQFIGIEIHKPSIEQVLKQCELQHIDNILVLDYDARLFMEFLPSNCVGKIFVHFPVPWDKKPHRRVMSQSFIDEALRVLIPSGQLELRTDSPLYFEFSLGEMLKLSKASIHIKKNEALEITSKYEDRWLKMEKDIYDVTLVNEAFSPPIPKVGTLKFSQVIDFQKLCQSFKEETIRGDSFFVHFEELYLIDATSGLIRISFGANERNEKCYIWIKNGVVSYFPDTVLATQNNINADKLIKEWINGLCN
ncbi:MAG: tRNA (guanosine(46)-N7)-methyltransferase TrmB [Sulfurospirillaceae bacterium]|nr:tRNA (guanosine(46)-N7)-methyltransferase TrmB [Sulfurospirillaceae bacterium]